MICCTAPDRFYAATVQGRGMMGILRKTAKSSKKKKKKIWLPIAKHYSEAMNQNPELNSVISLDLTKIYIFMGC